MKTLLFLGLAVLLFTSSCATILSGTREEILFTSEPSGVKVIMDGYTIGKTPIMLDVRRNLGGRWVAFELDGYESQYVKLEADFNAVSILNLTCLICWGVDLATGAATRYSLPSLYIELEPELPETIRNPK
ncbi:PEGA domain-containing protein [Neolewinella persica]|uniref:PEGA domain-containing protein n=1 Tax=Neolewinella persica TaxID=70998 RepID=UPI000381018B|nr:PEGA domain-containing protein [Neolewinella persica]